MQRYINEDLFYENSIDKQLVITTDDGFTITNELLHSESFTLTESICSSDDLEFGTCESSSCEFRVSNVLGTLKGKWITVKMYINHDTENPLLLGRFKVVSDRPSANRDWRDVVAYNKMYDVLQLDVTDWYNSLSFPMDVKTFRDKFFSHIGVTQERVGLFNDSFQLQKGLFINQTVMAKQILTALCEFNVCFGHIDRDDVFRYKYLETIQEGIYPDDSVIPKNDLYPKEFSGMGIFQKYYTKAEYEDFQVKQITKVQILNEENKQVGVYGSGDNVFIIKNNFFAYNIEEGNSLNNIAKQIYSKVSTIAYQPAITEAVGNPCLEVGEQYSLNTKDIIVYSYVLSRKLKGIQSLKDTYSAGGKEYRENRDTTLQNQINNIRVTNHTTNTALQKEIARVDELYADYISTTKLTAQEIQASNARISSLEADHVKVSDLTASNARISTLEADHVKVSDLTASNARISTLEADHVTVNSFNAVSSKVNTIESNYITANTVSTTYATIKSLNSVSASVNNISADYITSKSLQTKLENATTVYTKSLKVGTGPVYTGNVQFTINRRVYQCPGTSWVVG